MSSHDWTEAEIREAVLAQVARDSALPLQQQVSALQARLMLLEVGFLKQQRLLEKLVKMLEQP